MIQDRAAAPTDSPSRGRVRRRPALFPGIIFVLLGMNMVIVAITVYAATSDASFAIEPRYYEKALHWDDAAAQKRASDKLGWKVSVSLDAGAGSPMLVAKVTDRDGQAVSGIALQGEMFHNARSGDRRELTFTAAAPGEYAAPALVDRAGVWQVRLLGRRGDQTIVHDQTLDVVASEEERR
ncbi:MAG: FixH family protein [Phycisphaerales bacterium]